MTKELIQYIRTDNDLRDKIKTIIGKIKELRKNGAENRNMIINLENTVSRLNSLKGGQKIGVLTAEEMDDESVSIGFSFLNLKHDRWNHVDGRPKKNFGKFLSHKRALKFSNKHLREMIEKAKDDPEKQEKLNPMFSIPPKYSKEIHNFVKRCSAYYDWNRMPDWIKDNKELFQSDSHKALAKELNHIALQLKKEKEAREVPETRKDLIYLAENR